MELAKCECGGSIVPLSDTDKNGNEIRYKIWICIACFTFVAQRGGDPYVSQIYLPDNEEKKCL